MITEHGQYLKTGRNQRRIIAGRFKAPAVVENRYALKLRRVLQAIHAEYARSLDLRQDAYNKHSGTLDVLGVRVLAAIRKPVGDAFDEMTLGVKRANKLALSGIGVSDLRMSAEIKKYRDANIALMENAARAYAQQVRDVLEDPDVHGKRVEVLAKEIQARGSVSESRAELIARDQTLKLNGQINQTRQENAGVTQYTWSTSHDERVRESHRELDGETFLWSNPPEPGHPGQDFQCRCIALPVFDNASDAV